MGGVYVLFSDSLLGAIGAHALISIADTQGRIVYANDKFCQFSGYTEQELLAHI